MSDDNLFKEEIGDVKPLKQDGADVGKETSSFVSIEMRREAAVKDCADSNYLSTSSVLEISPHDIVSFKRPGIQDGVFKKLRLGKYAIDARLDLHQMTVEQARVALFGFIKDCIEYELRSVIILPGKGSRNAEGKAVLKSYSVFWLEDIPEVMAFHSAQQQHGGTGALYVLLKKSENAKNVNRERFNLKHGEYR